MTHYEKTAAERLRERLDYLSFLLEKDRENTSSGKMEHLRSFIPIEVASVANNTFVNQPKAFYRWPLVPRFDSSSTLRPFEIIEEFQWMLNTDDDSILLAEYYYADIRTSERIVLTGEDKIIFTQVWDIIYRDSYYLSTH